MLHAFHVDLFWPWSMHVLDSFWHDLGLFWLSLALWALIHVALVQAPWLVLSFEPPSMLCLYYVHDLA